MLPLQSTDVHTGVLPHQSADVHIGVLPYQSIQSEAPLSYVQLLTTLFRLVGVVLLLLPALLLLFLTTTVTASTRVLLLLLLMLLVELLLLPLLPLESSHRYLHHHPHYCYYTLKKSSPILTAPVLCAFLTVAIDTNARFIVVESAEYKHVDVFNNNPFNERRPPWLGLPLEELAI